MISARILILLVVLALGAGAGMWLERHRLPQDVPQPYAGMATDAGESALEHALLHQDPDYVCPMHPQIVRHQPGSCPICGMDLVAAEHSPVSGSVVTVNPGMVQNLGVRSVPAGRRTLWRRIDTVGYVEYDRRKLREVFPGAQGSIENLTVFSEGERVKKGQFLFEQDSPTLSRYFEQMYAQTDGIVADLRVVNGTWVESVDVVMVLADLSSVWVLVDVFENEAPWVKEGIPAEVRLPSLGDRVWEGKVQYIYPNLDPESRTLKVRLQFENPDEILKPNMLAEVTIFGGPKHDVLTIPRAALIETGKSQRVVVAEGGGRFSSRQILVGDERGNWIEVLSGLDEGEEVVVSGQFLIDSESSLQASLMRMTTDTRELEVQEPEPVVPEPAEPEPVATHQVTAESPEPIAAEPLPVKEGNKSAAVLQPESSQQTGADDAHAYEFLQQRLQPKHLSPQDVPPEQAAPQVTTSKEKDAATTMPAVPQQPSTVVPAAGQEGMPLQPETTVPAMPQTGVMPAAVPATTPPEIPAVVKQPGAEQDPAPTGREEAH